MAVGAVAATPSLSLAYIVGGLRFGICVLGCGWGERPSFPQHQPQLDNVLGAPVPTQDLHLHIASASLLLE